MRFSPAVALCVLCGLTFSAHALDREAFTFTRYDLNARVEPEQQRLGVRGKITLRNDSGAPLKDLVLQISSSLHWSSIRFEGKPVEFVSQEYTSDIDHTGALAEAVVVLPRPVQPKQSIDLEIGYEGVIRQDATRLTRIGVPPETAKHSDWDQIGRAFTAVRGIGYVAWYPIATEAASLSERSSVTEEVGRWKQREIGTEMRVDFSVNTEPRFDFFDKGEGAGPTLICDGPMPEFGQIRGPRALDGNCHFLMRNTGVPLFLVGKYQKAAKSTVQTFYVPEHKSGADDYDLAVEQVVPKINNWFGDHRDAPATKAEVIDLPDREWAPFESGSMLLLPLTTDETTMLLSALRQLSHLYFPSPRTWIADGLAAYAEANYFLTEKGPGAALAYLQAHRSALVQPEKEQMARNADSAESSLINSRDEFYVQAKAMNVWWMLRDMVGDTAFSAALHSYNPHDDNRADYMQKLIEAQAHRDLTWFFDDWVYQDKGLPDLRIVSVYPRKFVNGYLVTVTVENLGRAGAEVPITTRMAEGDVTKKLVIPANSKASIRISAPTQPQQVTVNDGSVPESNTAEHVYKIEAEGLNH